MNIGFDLDKVFIDYPPFVPSWIFDILYKNKRKKTLMYRFPNEIEQKIRRITHAPLLRPAIKKNISALQVYSGAKRHNLFLISSRFSFLKKRTDHLIKRHRFSDIFKKMYFNYGDQQPHLFKSKVIKRMKIKKYIDDDLDLLEYLSKTNKEAVFYWLNKRANKKLSKNLIAITDIKDFLK